MINTDDLNIEDEIIPLFDSTFNLNSGKAVRSILQEPLRSKEEILSRQHVLIGFTGNANVFNDYSFSRFDLTEIHDFFETFSAGSIIVRKLRRKLIFSEKERHQKRGRLVLLTLLFNRIHTSYLSKLDTTLFPEEYVLELGKLSNFLKDFNPEHYETIYRKKTIRVRHIIELMKVIHQKVTNGEAAAFWSRWFLFEACLSVSQGIIRHNFVFPTFEEKGFAIAGLYHPLLKNPVSNDLVAIKNVILLTGPNMSGKSTLLKALSLCVYLGHTGLAVPATSARMPFFETISVAINITDSVVSGYSHFMAEIITLKNVLKDAERGLKCFAVFDELFRGTNIEDALDISSVTIKGLVKFPASLFIISTHLHQLREMEEIKNDRVATCYIECQLIDNIPRFTYKLKPGWSDLKLGRILFEKEGLNQMLR